MGGVLPWKRPGGRLPPHPDQGRIIVEARTRAGWGQRKLADAVGITQPYLCCLETGKRALSPRTARRLGEVLGVAVPLPPIDIAQTAAGRQQAREQDRQRLGRIAQLQREVDELERDEHMRRIIWSGRRF